MITQLWPLDTVIVTPLATVMGPTEKPLLPDGSV
jgi:hypothetical protein